MTTVAPTRPPRTPGAGGLPAPALTAWVHGWPFTLLLAHLASSHATTPAVVAAAAGLSVGDLRLLGRCRPAGGRVPHRVGQAILGVEEGDILAARRALARLRPAAVAA